MFVGVLTLELLVHEASSLKDKRVVVNSMLDKIRARFNVSAAQIDNHDLWQRATLGIAVISNDKATAHTVLNHVRDLAETDLRCDVAQCHIEII
jgi:uncharacterized protein YlxP (DUF503 family)